MRARFVSILVAVPALCALLMPGGSPRAEQISESRTDLGRVCRTKTACTPRTWWVIQGFKSEYLEPGRFADAEGQAGWKRRGGMPLHIQDIFPEHKGPSLYTLRTSFDVAPKLLKGDRQPGIQFKELGDVYEIYLNGRLVGKQGEFRDGRIVFARMVRGLTYPINPAHLKRRGNELVIKVAGDPRFEQFAMYFGRGYSVGFYGELKDAATERFDLILIALYLFVGLYHLLLFFKRPGEKYNLHFGIFCVGLFIYLMTRTNVIFKLPWDTRVIHRIELVTLFLYIPHILRFVSSLYQDRARKAVVLFQAGSYLLALIVLFVPEWMSIHVLRVWQAYVFLLLTPIFIYLSVYGILKKITDARRLAVGAATLFLAGIYDILDSYAFHTGLGFQKYAFFAFIMAIAFILANRFIRVHNEVEDLNRDLEKKVLDRTFDLESSLSKIRSLKEKQDGDYFLTSLLINPLSANRADSETVGVEFLVRQFKRFRFRKWSAAIGGDICISQSIRLQDRSYTAVINADAMGKSMQGAGGALVFGAVMTSLLNRARHSRAGDYPEQWISEAYHELQSIFVSFQGSMMISAVIGLVDDASGLFYYINAEHPYPILYRNGETRLLVTDDELRKIGTPEADENLRIHVLRLRTGDVLFIGSDGKDDLVLGRDSDGRGIYNESESEFPKRVRESKSSLSEIEEALKDFGDLADDLTLVRVAYREDEYTGSPDAEGDAHDGVRADLDEVRAAGESERARNMLEEIVKEHPEDEEAALMLAELFFKQGQFGRLLVFAGSMSARFPTRDRFLFLAALGANRAGDHKTAVEFGERFRLRNPEHVDNLLNLARSRHDLGDVARARLLWLRARDLAPSHALVKEMKPTVSGPLDS